MTLTSILPRELVALVIEFYARDDSDSFLLRQVSKTLMDMSPRPKEGKGYILQISRFYSTFPLAQWAKENRCSTRPLALHAADVGNLEILRWLRRKGYQFTPILFHKAIAAGHLELVKWLRANGCPRSDEGCVIAAGYGHLEILKWLRIVDDNPWSEYTCAAAARGGHLDILKWLRKNGCPWTQFTTRRAASTGHLRILKWAIKNGCPWNPRYCVEEAIRNNHQDVVVWITQRLIEERNSSTR